MVRFLFYALILSWIGGECALAAEPSVQPYVAVTVLKDGKLSPGLADAIGVLLSQDGKAAVLERRQIDALLSEGALDRAITESDQKTKLGQLLGLDFFITLRIASSSEKGVIELVDALSGKVVSSRGTSSTQDPRAVATEMETLLSSQPPAKPGGISPSVAVIDFTSSPVEEASFPVLKLGLADELRKSLTGAGLTVLDRSFSNEVVREHLIQENGMTAAVQAAAPLLGADYLIYGEVKGDHIRLRLLHAAATKSVGERDFPLSTGESALLPPEAILWLLAQIQNGNSAPTLIAPTLQPEVLVPFYRGLADFQQGRYLQAMSSFRKTRMLNTQFDDAYQWEARCYDALGMPELSAAERRFVVKKLAEYGEDRPVKARQSEGITFVGLHGESFDTLEIRRLEMETIDAVSSRMPEKLQLPDDLARFRNEYDLFVGVGQSQGKSWSSTPNFLTRWSLEGHVERSEKSGITITWKILDTLSLKEKNVIRTSIPSDSAQAKRIIGEALATAINSTEQHSGFTPAVGIPSIEELLHKLSIDGDKSETNQALLGILLQDPSNPVLLGRELSEDGSDIWNLQGFMNFALRDYLISHLPPKSSYRQWLELYQLTFYMPAKPRGSYFSGKKIDVFDALAHFRDAHRGKITACVAEYMILWEHLDEVPAKILLERLQKLRADIPQSQGVEELSNVVFFEKQVEKLIDLVELAYGLADPLPPLPRYVEETDEGAPARLLLNLPIGDKASLRIASYWRANDWNMLDNPTWANPRQEALAALHILGRKTEAEITNPAWFKESPDSIAVLAFAADGLSKVGASAQQPMLHPFDTGAERDAFKDVVAYCYNNLLADMAKVESLKQAEYLEKVTERVIHGLTDDAFEVTITDVEFDRLRSSLAQHIEEMHHRLGDVSFQGSQLSWMRKPRRGPPTSFNVNLPAPQSEIEASYSNRALQPKDTEFLFNYSLALIHASQLADAERWLQKIIDQINATPSSQDKDEELYANALLQIAFCQHCQGRSAEAVPRLKEAADIAQTRQMKLISEITPNERKGSEDESLHHMTLRLLDEIRIGLLPSNLPPNVLCIPVQVSKLGGMKINYYIRIPKDYQANGIKKYPVLLLIPPLYESTPDYCLDSNPWAQFADKEGFFLIVPQFLSILDLNSTAKRYHYPQNWSGKTTLDMIDQLAEHYRISKEKLFLHGYGSGGGFVQRFARWAPDRIAAVSTHSSESWEWHELTQGLQSLSKQKNIPYLITCGSEDNQSIRLEDRLHRGIRLVSNLRAEGAVVIWKEWTDVAHEQLPQMEQLSRAFLSYYIKNKPDAEIAFVGDLRDGTYLPANDSRVLSIPAAMRQPLPDEKIASLWGSPR